MSEYGEDNRLSADDKRAVLEEALDRSGRELKNLASFYHLHGFEERAKEIYSSLLRLSQPKNREQSRDS